MAVLSAFFKGVDNLSPTLTNIASKGEELNSTLAKVKESGSSAGNALAGVKTKSEATSTALGGVGVKSEAVSNALSHASSNSRNVTQAIGEMSSKTTTATASTAKWTDAIGNYDKSAMEALYTTDELVDAGFKVRTVFEDEEKAVGNAEKALSKQERVIDDVTDAFEALQKEQKDYNSIIGDTVDESDALAGSFKDTESRSHSMGDGFSAAGSKGTSLTGILKKLAVAAAGVITIGAAISFGADLTKSYIDFESGMSEVFTLLPGMSEAAMNSMTDDLKSFSAESGVLTNESVPALYSALSAGVNQDTVFDFLGTANKAAIGGVTSIETAVDGLSSVVNAYGENILSADMTSDYMFTTVKLGKTTFEELAGSLYNVVPTAVGAGVAFSDVSAALSAMTAQGVPTATATTQLRQTLVELSQSGTEVNELFGKLSGESFKQFIAGGGNLQDALILLEDHAKASNLGINDLFSSVEAGSAALVLTGTGTDKFTSSMDEMASVAGATEAAFSTMEESVGYKVEKMQAKWEGFKLDMGESLAVAVSPVVDVLADNMEQLQTPLANLFGYVAESITRITPLLPGLANALVSTAETVWGVVKPVLDFIADNPDTVAMAIAGLGAVIISSKIISGISGIGGAIASLGTSLLANPATAIIVGLTAAIVAIGIACYQTYKQAKEADLAARFGDISLSMEELDNVAEKMIMNDNLYKVGEALASFGTLDSIAKNIEDATSTIDRLNWQIGIGLQLDTEEQAQYKSAIESYIANVQDYATKRNYSLQLGVEATLDIGGAEYSQISQSVSEISVKMEGQLTELGDELSSYVTEAFSDGIFDIDEQAAAAEIQSKMAAIEKIISDNEYKASLTAVSLGYEGSALTSDTYQQLQNDLNAKAEEQAEAVKETYIKTLAGLGANVDYARNAYEESGSSEDFRILTEAESAYDAYSKSDYYKKLIDEPYQKASEFALNTLNKAFADEINTISEMLDGEDLESTLSENAKNFDFGETLYDTYFKPFYEKGLSLDENLDDMVSEFDKMLDQSIDWEARSNAEDMYKSLDTRKQQIMAIIASSKEAGTAVDKALTDELSQINFIGALSGDEDAMRAVLYSAFNPESSVFKEIGISITSGIKTEIAPNVEDAINNSFSFVTLSEEAKAQMKAIGEAAGTTANEAFTAAWWRTATPVPKTEAPSSSYSLFAPPDFSELKTYGEWPAIEANALGTTNSAEAFLAGEEGPEIVVGKPSSTVFPADVSAALLQLPTLNGASQTQLNAAKKITLEMLGNGSIKIGKGADKEEILTVLIEYLKPVLMDILSREILEEGDESYVF